ncbi:MAG: cache domain-containing protein [Rubrivivax sp.]|nr:cache domain-containing protein [Rubrivivax sp.]
MSVAAPFPPALSAPGDRSSATAAAGGFFAYHGFWAPGVRLFRLLRFSAKASIISLAFTLPLLAVLGWLITADYQHALQARKDATRQHVEIAHGIIAWAQAQEAAGKMPREQAQQAALRTLAGLRYDGNEYFWVNDMHPRVLMHPIKPELDGKDVGGMKDPNGLALFQAFVAEVRRAGKGFVAYQWPKPGHDQPVDKVSYVMGFEPWGWIVGSGVYTGDLREAALRRAAWIGGIVVGALMLAAYLFLCFYRVMDGGLRETRRHLRAMTEGDLTTSPAPWGGDEAAQLMLELRAMQESLRAMVLRVRRSSDDIVHSSSEIATGAMDLSARTEQAAANLEQSAASMEQIAATVKSTADHTHEAAQVARHNASTAATGGAAMANVVQTMEGIRASSAQIGEIVGTIDSLAFQTNILALNAAVEAARAGEEGRGFAVVASEVRTLAQRSAEAGRKIKALIGSSVEQVEAGASVVREAGTAIEAIVTDSRRVDELLGEIATSAGEQSMGVGQIGQAVQELDRMTQQNAALVEQTAAAASAMKSQAQRLAVEVARFRTPAGLEAESEQIAAPADFDFDKAIEAHRQWKVRLRKAIAEHARLDVDTICRDDQCPLGKWIHGAGGARWGTRPTFVELVETHAGFHRSAADVARQINAGQYAQAEQMIGSGSRFGQLSTEVATILTRAKRGL